MKVYFDENAKHANALPQKHAEAGIQQVTLKGTIERYKHDNPRALGSKNRCLFSVFDIIKRERPLFRLLVI